MEEELSTNEKLEDVKDQYGGEPVTYYQIIGAMTTDDTSEEAPHFMLSIHQNTSLVEAALSTIILELKANMPSTFKVIKKFINNEELLNSLLIQDSEETPVNED